MHERPHKLLLSNNKLPYKDPNSNNNSNNNKFTKLERGGGPQAALRVAVAAAASVVLVISPHRAARHQPMPPPPAIGCRCYACGLEFCSRNQLFKHLKSCAAAPEAPGGTPSAPSTVGRFRYSELFAGVGGFRVALDAVGGKCVWACEIEGQARKCYLENWPAAGGSCPLARDVRDTAGADVPAHDLLTGGFPCQPFSSQGHQAGLEHRLGLLFSEVVRLLRSAKPRMFLCAASCSPPPPSTHKLWHTPQHTHWHTHTHTHTATHAPPHRFVIVVVHMTYTPRRSLSMTSL